MDQDHYQSRGTAEQSNDPIGRTTASGSGPLSYMENTVITGAYPASQRDLEFRPVEHSTLGTPLEGPHFQAPVMGSSYESVVRSSYLATGSNCGHGYTGYYNEHCIRDVDRVSTIRASETRGPKRKVPRYFFPGETGSTSTFYTAGSSSSLPESHMEEITSAFQNYPSTASFPHYHSNGLAVGDESFQRNVRSRSRLDLDAAPRRNYQSNFPPYQYHPTIHFTNHFGGITTLGNERTPSGPEQNHIPLSATPGRIASSESNRMSHQMNQHLIGGGGPAENGDSRHDPTLSRNPALPLQYRHRFQTHTRREDHINHPYPQWSLPPRRAGLSLPLHPHSGHGTVSSENNVHSLPERYLSRYARPSSAGGGRHNRWDGRSRLSTEGYEVHDNTIFLKCDGMDSI